MVSVILHPLHTIEEEVLQTPETPVTPNDNKLIMTRVMFKDIMSKAVEEQKSMADTTRAEVVKVACTESVKKGSELQTQPLHSSTIEHEVVRYLVEQSLIMPPTENGLTPTPSFKTRDK